MNVAPMIARSERRHVRVGADLEKALATREHEERAQEQRVRAHGRRRDEQRRAYGAHEKAGDDASTITGPPHDPARRQRRQKVPAEERRLDERRPEIREAEELLEMRNQDVVEVDAERPQKEQARDEDERQHEAPLGERRARIGAHWMARSRCV